MGELLAYRLGFLSSESLQLRILDLPVPCFDQASAFYSKHAALTTLCRTNLHTLSSVHVRQRALYLSGVNRLHAREWQHGDVDK